MKKYHSIISIIGVIVLLSSCTGTAPTSSLGTSTEPTPVSTETVAVPAITETTATATRFPPDEKDVILDAEDFFYTSKEEGYTLWIGMEKDACFAMIDSIDPDEWEINTYYYEDRVVEYYVYFDQDLRTVQQLIFVNGTLYSIYKKETGWEICKGINNGTTPDELFSVFGRPTCEHSVPYVGYYHYYFYKTDGDKYIKFKNEEELNIFINMESLTKRFELRSFYCIYDESSGKLDLEGIGYVYASEQFE
ncbi:MAG: hypothetical protein FWE80_04830 [Oscillospiraceae bacterium]|nr:hypothetical protein [Oscillospiraceae bacterium]